MVDLIKLFSNEGKGSRSTYRPAAGTVCEVSGPNCDDDSGYVFGKYEILWGNEIFVLYGAPNCWPNLHKWEHVICRPIVVVPDEMILG